MDIIFELNKNFQGVSQMPKKVLLTKLILTRTHQARPSFYQTRERSSGRYYQLGGMVEANGHTYHYQAHFIEHKQAESLAPKITGDLPGARTFSHEALKAYLLHTGDQNPLHSTEDALVPGLMQLALVLDELNGPLLNLTAKWLNPLYVDQAFVLDYPQPQTICLRHLSKAFARFDYHQGDSHETHAH